MKHEGWELSEGLDLELDPVAVAGLERFEHLLLDQAVPMGMVAPSDAPRLRERHIIDSLRAAPFLPERGAVCDLGSGAGLPGLVLAMIRPDLRFVLVEVRRNRAAFLERAADGLQNVTVHGRRLETFREKVQTCLARAFAPARKSWEAAEPLLTEAGTLIYWGGVSFEVATDVPDGVSSRLFRTSALARSGPLVIMARQ